LKSDFGGSVSILRFVSELSFWRWWWLCRSRMEFDQSWWLLLCRSRMEIDLCWLCWRWKVWSGIRECSRGASQCWQLPLCLPGTSILSHWYTDTPLSLLLLEKNPLVVH
jgi:hypothetical protein